MNANSLTLRSIARVATRLGLTLFLPAIALLLLISLLSHSPVVSADNAPLAWKQQSPLAEPIPISETPLLTLTGETSPNFFGHSVASAGDVNGDGFADVIVGAPDNPNRGHAYLYLGSAAGLPATPVLTFTGETGGDGFGVSVASAGDVNGDGFADALISACGPITNVSRVYLYLGSAAGLDATPALTLTGGNNFGLPAASAGDVNGDGFADVIVGANSSIIGRAYLYLGSAAGLTVTPALTLTNKIDFGSFGCSVTSAGDVNGDGLADVLIGASGNSSDLGYAYLYLGSTAGLSTTPTLTLTGEAIGNGFGGSVASAGDVNGDGYADALVGAAAYNGIQGRAYLYLGGATGLSVTPALTLTGETTWNYFGRWVASAGDVNSDGLAEFIVGAYYYGDGQGRAYLYLGSAAGLPATPALTLTGEAANNYFGRSVASAGDVNGDGYAEFIVGAPVYNNGRGRAYLYGRSPAPDLSLVKSANVLTATPGSSIQFTLAISNNGPGPASSVITVTDMLPNGLTNVSAAGDGWTCDTAALSTITCTANGLAVGPAPGILITANAPLTPGWVTNTACIASLMTDPTPLNNTSSASIEIIDTGSDTLIYLPIVLRSHIIIH